MHGKPEVAIVDGHIKKYNAERERMVVEDLAALDKLTEDKIINEIKERLLNGESYSFIGDVLLSLNSNELPNKYPRSVSFLLHCNRCFFLDFIQKFHFFLVSQ